MSFDYSEINENIWQLDNLQDVVDRAGCGEVLKDKLISNMGIEESVFFAAIYSNRDAIIRSIRESIVSKLNTRVCELEEKLAAQCGIARRITEEARAAMTIQPKEK